MSKEIEKKIKKVLMDYAYEDGVIDIDSYTEKEKLDSLVRDLAKLKEENSGK